MMALISFIVGIIAVIMTFIEPVRLAGFAIGMIALILSIIAGYQKEKKQSKDSPALEIGSIIISGAAVLSYLIILFVR